ncbi:LytTR family transcriptional regulator DNA-binding domain-containing protein [Cohnella silvisoli]|uniref:LytTR family transcriptional regulator DNA-binding domain-containing protein n=1 Tax=Cohnella silvisoli TaxID=2873699 RepID=A0ABV1KV03_9BACL|nr:LytTR family transcriptional regulator DNA-binding domain-containing protein [Cohnella silvisoli]MCD9023293.1 LytTR family transcriptional regulator DNA-binding domain-containing protein [Cohnella silvisoli]
MLISVTDDVHGKNGIINVEVSEILFLEFDMVDRWVTVHTLEAKYYITGTLSYWADSLKGSGFEFEKADRNVVIHVPMIKRMDRVFAHAYFEYEINHKSKKVTLSQKHFKQILTKMRVANMGIVVV